METGWNRLFGTMQKIAARLGPLNQEVLHKRAAHNVGMQKVAAMSPSAKRALMLALAGGGAAGLAGTETAGNMMSQIGDNMPGSSDELMQMLSQSPELLSQLAQSAGAGAQNAFGGVMEDLTGVMEGYESAEPGWRQSLRYNLPQF